MRTGEVPWSELRERRMAGTGAAWRVTKQSHVEQFAHAVFPSTFAELVAVTGGEPADVAYPDRRNVSRPAGW